jgi:hypothetical protein
LQRVVPRMACGEQRQRLGALSSHRPASCSRRRRRRDASRRVEQPPAICRDESRSRPGPWPLLP